MAMTSDYASNRSLSALFDTRAEADRAVAALETAGIADVVLTGSDNEGYGSVDRSATRTTHTDTDADYREKGFFEQLGDFFFPDEDRYTYAEGLDRGGFLVTVDNIPADKYERALDILDDEGAVDLDAREQEWRSEGWNNDVSATSAYGTPAAGYAATEAGYSTTASGYTDTDSTIRDDAALGNGRDDGLPGTMASRAADRVGDALSGDRTYDEADLDRDGTIDIAEERLFISKRETDLGRVRVRSYVKETPVEETVNLRQERVSIERRPVDRAATDADFHEQSIEAREYSEEAVVNKEARVVEEVNLRTDASSRDEVVRDTVRKTEVEVLDERGNPVAGGDRLRDDKI